MIRNDFDIETLGPCEVGSPLLEKFSGVDHPYEFEEDDDRILVDDRILKLSEGGDPGSWSSMEQVGPRRKIYFEPRSVGLGIVTCGGLCPGLNNVIQGLVTTAHEVYGVRECIGFRYGFRGIAEEGGEIFLTPESVGNIDEYGGTILGTSRGEQDVGVMVDRLVALKLSILFVIGGDGTTRGALAISEEIKRRGLKIAVVGIPKTIDNDFKFMDISFGHQTAYSKAVDVLDGAHREAQAAPNGIGLVKLMGRHSGFIACSAALASNDANFVLIPEVPFKLDGAGGFLQALEKRILQKPHALVVVAEGAGQDLLMGSGSERDASGNVKLKDIGPFLVEKIKDHFKARNLDANIKYIDPSYIIRSVKASPQDSLFCFALAKNAVHAAMCGKTAMVVGLWHQRLVHVPMKQAIKERNVVDLASPLWTAVLGSTGQSWSFA